MRQEYRQPTSQYSNAGSNTWCQSVSISLLESRDKSPRAAAPAVGLATTDPFRNDKTDACLPRAPVAGLLIGDPATPDRCLPPPTVGSPTSETLSAGRNGDGAKIGLPSTEGVVDIMLPVLSLRCNMGDPARAWSARSESEGEGMCGEDDDASGVAVLGGDEKNRTRNVNSAEALSRRTKASERKRASTGCFCIEKEAIYKRQALHLASRGPTYSLLSAS